jgi:MFS transporter, FSR family, fosmidomycin resistance protein
VIIARATLDRLLIRRNKRRAEGQLPVMHHVQGAEEYRALAPLARPAQCCAMTQPSARLAQGFSNVGHTLDHTLTLLYPTVVLALEREWGLGFNELMALMIAGQILFGAGALPAGWLGDRWSMLGMMVVYFLGIGLACIATGFARNPFEVALGLAVTGLFASIYHPVGMAWLVRAAENRGRALGVNGMFGAFGVALGPIVAAACTDFISWRAAFILPGALTVLIGLALLVAWRLGYVADNAGAARTRPEPQPSNADVKRAFLVMTLTMTCVGLIGNTFMVILPKLFQERLTGIVGDGTFGVGALVTTVFFIAAFAQYAGGRLADRIGMRRIYLASFLLQAPILFAAGFLESWPLLIVAVAMVFINIGSLPSENGLIAHFTPPDWRGAAYGAKFVLALGVSGMAIPIAAEIYTATGGFTLLFVLLAACAAIVAFGAWLLPDDRHTPMAAQRVPNAVPAAAE